MPAFLRAILHSYSMLFFSQHRGAAGLLLLATFAHPGAGLAGLGAATLAVAGARLGGFSRTYTDLGAYSFNALLVGLALPLYFAPGAGLAALVGLGAGLALLLSVALGGWLGGRGLPFLSLPFVLVMWLLLLGTRHLPQLVPADAGGVYWLNDAYALGGQHLATAARWASEADWPPMPATFLRALSAVLLQDSPWAGLLVAAGLLWHSRIAFSLATLAFLGAWGLAALTGGAAVGPGAYDLGANYIMAAVAVAGVFALPSAGSYGWGLLSLPVTAVFLVGAEAVLRPATGGAAGLPTLSLPYCLTSLLFLYVLLLREQPGTWLLLTPLQRYSPEANLYAHLAGLGRRLASAPAVPLALPFLGEWRCTQGYADGGPTHQGPWGQALDFVVTDDEARTYHGSGQALSDYYCFDKPVLAPADGTVEEVVQHLPDNTIGQVDTQHNWGNTVVLRHAPGVYSQLSHLRMHSVRVRPGQTVRRGDVLATCGSSGRSPEPHLHFQVQAVPAIGSPTLAYPLAHFLVNKPASAADLPKHNVLRTPAPPPRHQEPNTGHQALKTATVPQAGDLVQQPVPQPPLGQALHLPPGLRLAVASAAHTLAPAQVWEVFTDAYNTRYLRCEQTGAVLYFEQDEAVFQCTAYYGSRRAPLYAFYLAAYRVPLCYLPQPEAVALPLSVVRSPWLGWLQDVAAPFFRFVRPVFALSWGESPFGPAARQIGLHSLAAVRYLGREKLLQAAQLTIVDGTLASLTVQRGAQETTFTFTAAG